MNIIEFEVVVEKSYFHQKKETYQISLITKIDGKQIFNYKEIPTDIIELIKSREESRLQRQKRILGN
jgi:hypothetical protein